MAPSTPHRPGRALLALGSALAALAAPSILAAAPSAAAGAVAAEPAAALAPSEAQRGRAAPVQPRGAQGRSRSTQGRSRSTQGRSRSGSGAGRGALGGQRGSAGQSRGDEPATGESPLSGNPFGVPAEQKRRAWFQTADADSTGWVSFREARTALGFDAARFRVFDADNDGRFTEAEYTAFLRQEVGSGREPAEPRQPTYGETPPPRDAEQLRLAYDVDLDEEISRFELDRILLAYGGLRPGSRLDLSAAEVMQQLDTDGDQTLDVNELDRLANYLTPASVDPRGAARPGARTIDDLFANESGRSGTGAPRIAGPVSVFRRLDLDGDGYITPRDLERLEGRAFSTVNLSSLINTLDIDFDGRLHEGEFLDALSPRRR